MGEIDAPIGIGQRGAAQTAGAVSTLKGAVKGPGDPICQAVPGVFRPERPLVAVNRDQQKQESQQSRSAGQNDQCQSGSDTAASLGGK